MFNVFINAVLVASVILCGLAVIAAAKLAVDVMKVRKIANKELAEHKKVLDDMLENHLGHMQETKELHKKFLREAMEENIISIHQIEELHKQFLNEKEQKEW